MPQPKPCGKGTGSSGGISGMGSRGANPLANLSNLTGCHGFQRKEPSTTLTPAATSQPPVARATKYTRPGSSSAPRDPPLRTGQKQKSYHRRFSLLSINSLDSTSTLPDPGGSTCHLGNTALGGAAETAARLAPMESSPRLTVNAGVRLSVETPRKHQAVSLNVETPREHQAAVKGSSGETPRKHQTVTGYKAAQKHCIKEKTGGSSSGGMAQKCCTKERTLPSRQVRHPLGTQRAGTIDRCITTQKQSENNPSISSNCLSLVSNAVPQHCKELAADKKIHLPEEMMKQVLEADLVIKQLNELGLGEDINDEELQCYYEQLPCEHTCVDTSLELGDEQIKKLQVNHVLCRIKYYKMTQERRKNELASVLEYDCYRYRLEEKLKCFVEDETKLKRDHILDHLDKEGLLEYIEKDDTFDWSFQYRTVAALDDYQRLVPRNRGGSEYVHWNDYREYFHKYEIEREYLLFWKELLKKLKWMEDYLNIKWTTLKWDRINKRGESQAIKIATGFPKITVGLAHAAYYECIDYMSTEFHWYRELDGVYFEIWKRVAKLEMSFREALDEVYKSGKFLLREHEMEHALEISDFKMEEEFRYCTEGITEEDTEEKARELIADAITKMLRRPKFYAQYIMKKMEVATAIGVIPQGAP